MRGRTTTRVLLAEVGDGLVRSWWTVTAGTCLGLSLALVILQFTPRIYSATATLHLDSERLPDLTSDRHLDVIISELFEIPVDSHRIRSNVRVGGPDPDGYLTVSYLDEDRERAAAVANRLAEFYVEGAVEVIRAAAPPTLPVYPRPLLFYGAGVGFGLLLFVGPVICRRALVPAASFESRILSTADVPVLIKLPSFPTPAALRRAKGIRIKNAVLSLLCATVLIAVYSAKRLDWL